MEVNTTESHEEIEIEDRYVLLKDSIAQDKKRDIEYRIILEDQIKMLKDEMLYKNILIDEQVSIIKNLFTLNEKSNNRQSHIIETRSNKHIRQDINNSEEILNHNNGNGINSDSSIINSHVVNPRNTPEDCLATNGCYSIYENDDVINTHHHIDNRWITMRNKTKKKSLRQ